MDALEQALADVRGDAKVRRAPGEAGVGDALERVADRVAELTREWTRFLSESDALLYSGKGIDFLRARRSDWQARGHAERRGRVWYYRQCVLPHRPDLTAEFQAGAGERTTPAGGGRKHVA